MARKQTQPPSIGLIILAAGASRRMKGEDKLLKTVNGVALLRRVLMASVASAASKITVVLRPDDTARQATISDFSVAVVENSAHTQGMATSIRAGIQNLAHERLDGVIVVLADMPDVESSDIDRLIAAFDTSRPETICRATNAAGRPGHPVLFGCDHFEALAHLHGDQGGKSILSDNARFIIDVPLSGDRAITDLDRPEDWARYLGKSTAPD